MSDEEGASSWNGMETVDDERRQHVGVHTRAQQKRALNATIGERETEYARVENARNAFAGQVHDGRVTETNNLSLQQIIQLLTLKIQADEVAQMTRTEPKITADNFSKIVPDYDGESVPVEHWLLNFEQNADAYELTKKQKYVQARGKMVKTAQLCLESTFVNSYEQLKDALINEFKRKTESAEIHKKLQERRKKKEESFHEYVLNMRKIGALGQVDMDSIITYIVDGLDVKSEYKFSMYNCKSLYELKEKYDVYERKCVSERQGKQHSIVHSGSQKNMHSVQKGRCFNCGSFEHIRKECNVVSKCFKCNAFGHISKNCPQEVKTVQTVKEMKRLKNIRINNIELLCLVDTGSDVSIVCWSTFKKLKYVALEKCYSELRGLGKTRTQPIGAFEGTVQIDDNEVQQRFIMVPDGDIAYDGLLGFDFASQFCLTLNKEGYRFSKVSAWQDTAEVNKLSICNIAEIETDINAPPQFKPLIQSLVDEFKPVSGDVECPVLLKIVSDEKMTPFRQQPSRHLPVEAEGVKEQDKLRLEMTLNTIRKEARREWHQRDEQLEDVRGNGYTKNEIESRTKLEMIECDWSEVKAKNQKLEAKLSKLMVYLAKERSIARIATER